MLALGLIIQGLSLVIAIRSPLKPVSITRANISQLKMSLSSGSVLTDQSLAYEAISKFLKEDVTFRPTVGGVNNVVQYVETSKGDKYVLRIYNNGFNTERVNYEMAILDQLRPMNLSFQVPTTIKSINEGISHVELSNGARAALFLLIPGKLPKLTLVNEIGVASGELNTALADVKLDTKSPNPVYHDIYAAHHFTTRENFFGYIQGPEFSPYIQGPENEGVKVAMEFLVSTAF
jgi:hypothetical protein